MSIAVTARIEVEPEAMKDAITDLSVLRSLEDLKERRDTLWRLEELLV